MTSKPTAVVSGLDHTVVVVRDIARGKAAYEALGFRLTPEGRHTVLQSVNHCIMFAEDYIELIAFVGEHPSRRYLLDFIKRREGMAAMALKSPDIAATKAAWDAAGLASAPPLAFGRPVERPGGVRQAEFRTVIIDERETPPGRTFACQHFTPELVWLPEYQAHPNGAQAIDAVIISAEDVAAIARIYGRILAVPVPAPGADGTVSLPAGGCRLVVMPAARLAATYPELGALPPPAYAGARVRVADLAACASLLQARGIAFRRTGNGTLVADPARSCGALVEFV